MPLRQRLELPARLSVELDKNQIPDFQTARIPLIDQLPLRLSLRRQIHMHLRARPARTRLSHHPKVVLRVPHHHVNRRIQPRFLELVHPVSVGLGIKLGRIPRPGLVNRGVKSGRRKFPDIDQKLPRPVDRLLFEIIPERPVPQHFKKCVVVGVETDVLQIVVFTARPDALLRIGRPSG